MSPPSQQSTSSTGSEGELPLLNRPLLDNGDATVVNTSAAPASDAGFEISTGADEIRSRLFPPIEAPAGQESGLRLGHFEVQKKIGAGGMGAVFLARDLELNRNVALKVLNPKTAADPSLVARFRKEARASAQMNHDNVARVYFAGQQNGVPFIAYEYAEGRTIRELIIANGKLPVPEVVNYAIQVTLALGHIDACSIVHRDIKPSNIIRTSNGRIKVVDLGLARHETDDSIGELTVAGTTLGTFDYIAPEQARDPRNADTRSDIYSLGCTMFHMLTGSPPYEDGNAIQKLLDHQGKDAPDILAAAPGTPKSLVAVIVKMMDPDPGLRYQDPGQLLADLIALASQLGLRSVPAEGIVWRRIPVQRTRELSGPILISSVALICCLIALSMHFFPSFRNQSDEQVKSLIAAMIRKQPAKTDADKTNDLLVPVPPVGTTPAGSLNGNPPDNPEPPVALPASRFVVVSTDGTETPFDALTNAWSEAKTGDEILLDFDGEFLTERFPQLPAGESQIITIRAKEGRSPTLTFRSDNNDSLLTSQLIGLSNQLQLRLSDIGLRFEIEETEQDRLGRNRALFAMTGTNRLSLNDCVIDIVNPASVPTSVIRMRDTATTTLDDEADSTQIEFVNCRVRGTTDLIQNETAGSATINLSNCAFVLNGSLLQNLGSPTTTEGQELNIELTYCSCLLLQSAFSLTDSEILDGGAAERTLASLNIDATSNVFACLGISPFIQSSGNASAPDQQSRVSWRGTFNRYFEWSDLWVIEQGLDQEPVRFQLDNWTTRWNQQVDGQSDNETEILRSLWEEPELLTALIPDQTHLFPINRLSLDRSQFDLTGDGLKLEKLDYANNYPGVDFSQLARVSDQSEPPGETPLPI